MISIKKVGVVVATAGLLAASAVPAFASEHHHGGRNSNSTTINQSNDGSVNNDVSVNANTGFNRGGSVTTGNAFAGAAVSAVGSTNIASVGGSN